MEALTRRLAVARTELAELRDKFARTLSLSISLAQLSDQRDAVAQASLKVLRLEHQLNLLVPLPDSTARGPADFAAEALRHGSHHKSSRPPG